MSRIISCGRYIGFPQASSQPQAEDEAQEPRPRTRWAAANWASGPWMQPMKLEKDFIRCYNASGLPRKLRFFFLFNLCSMFVLLRIRLGRFCLQSKCPINWLILVLGSSPCMDNRYSQLIRKIAPLDRNMFRLILAYSLSHNTIE